MWGQRLEAKLPWFLPLLKARMFQGGKNCKTDTKFIIRSTRQHVGEHTGEVYSRQKQNRNTHSQRNGVEDPPNEDCSKFSSVQSLSRVWLFATPWITACQASLSITNSRSLLKLTSIKSVMPSSHLILCRPLLLLPSIFPRIRVYSSEPARPIRWPNIGVSALASFLPMNTQDLSLLEWTGWISLQSKGLSRVFSNTTVQNHQFFGTQLSSQSNSHIHTWLLEKP